MRRVSGLSQIAVAILAATLCSIAAAATQPPDPDVDALPQLRLVEEMRIGSATDPVRGFTRIGTTGGVDVDRDGQIYVVEAHDYQIRIYSPGGTLLRTMGRQGQGPGEFQSIPRIGVAGDTVWAIETGPQRITLFNRMGRLLTTARFENVLVPAQGVTTRISPTSVRADGRLTGTTTGEMPDRASRIALTDTVQTPRVVFSATGVPLDTLGWDRRLPPSQTPVRSVAVSGIRWTVPRASPDAPLTVVFPEGRLYIGRARATSAAPTAFRVTRITMEGDTIYSGSYRYNPVRYAPALLDSLAARVAQPAARAVPGPAPAILRAASDPAAFKAIRDEMSFPPFETPIETVFMGTDGSAWLRREEDVSPNYRWVLLDPQGRPRGRLVTQPSQTVAWARGDIVWAVVPDKDDVPWLVKYRISP